VPQDDELVHMLDLTGSLSEVSTRAARSAERLKIRQALELSNWNKSKASELLDISYKTLLNKVKEYGLG
jgi:two-component system response regulator AtoC